ncbi:MAG: PASTA domain-containing protein [Eubacteriales bacterium]|nr:PASTA domain-containing protein [Eubacteriales bacterium]
MFRLHPFAGRRAALCAALALVLCIASACAVPPAVPEAATTPATPAPTAACDVPDLQFETESYAREALSTRGMSIDVEYVATSDIPAGLVADQSVKAGECPVENAPVKLLVSVPTPTPEPTPEPTPTPKPAKKSTAKNDAQTLPQVNPAMPAAANPFPQVTPQPTWNIDMSMFDEGDIESSAPCG